MSETLNGVFVNAETGETIERELNAEELETLEFMQNAEQEFNLDQEAKAAARASALAKLAELGLTEEEVAAL
jgi:hypothetical protein